MPQPGERFNPYRFFNGIYLPEVLLTFPVSWGAKVCYARLCRFAGANGHAFPKQETLGATMGISARQARTYLSELEQVQLIRREKGSGRGQPSRYVFLYHPDFHRDMHTYSDEVDSVETAKVEGSDRKHTSKTKQVQTRRNPSQTGRNPPVLEEESHGREGFTPPTPPSTGGGAPRKKRERRKTKTDRMRDEIHRRLKREQSKRI